MLPTGEIVATGGQVVKNVVGYDLAPPRRVRGDAGDHPRRPSCASSRSLPFRPHFAPFPSVESAVDAVTRLIRARVVPRRSSLSTASASTRCPHARGGDARPARHGRLLLIEVDGLSELVQGKRRASIGLPGRRRDRGPALEFEAERIDLWRVRRELSHSLKTIAPIKHNHDVVVPKGRVSELIALVKRLQAEYPAADALFQQARRRRQHSRQHHGQSRRPGRRRVRSSPSARSSKRWSRSRSRSAASTASASQKAPYISIELSPDEIAPMKREGGVRSERDP